MKFVIYDLSNHSQIELLEVLWQVDWCLEFSSKSYTQERWNKRERVCSGIQQQVEIKPTD